MPLQWTTPSGFICTATESVSTSVAVVAAGTSVSYSIISGQLPNGLTLNSNGTISGTPSNVLTTATSKFVIRASDSVNVSDRMFSIDVAGPNPPTWITSSSYLTVGYGNEPFAYNNQYVEYQLDATPTLSPSGTTITYKLAKGKLPPGLHLSESGLITGVVKDHLSFDGFGSVTGGYDTEKFDGYSYDHVMNFAGTITTVQLTSVPKTYQFDVLASDGVVSATNSLKIMVVNPEMFRADSVYMTYDTSTISTSFVPSSISYLQPPVFLNDSNLGTVRAGKNIDLDVTAYDADSEEGYIVYSLVTTTNILTQLPNDLKLDSTSGHIYGYIEYQPAYTKIYSLTVAATKHNYMTTSTITVVNTFTVAIQGSVYSSIEWVTDSNLGSIESQTQSELSVLAKQISSDYTIRYQVVSGSLPEGLTLNRDGSISGKASFNSIGTYTFTVLAADVYELSAITREFTLTVTQSAITPFTSIYVKPFMKLDQRQQFRDFISDTKIFQPQLMYRYFDPDFGVQPEMKMYIEYGIEKLNLDSYANALTENFYPTKFNFGDVSIAVANDLNGNPIYEVVYLPVIDSQSNKDGQSPPLHIEMNNSLYHPASISNMRSRLETLYLGESYVSVDEYSLPLFMRTPQAGQYAPPGYMPVIPLCYALPGQGYKIVDRIKLSKFDFSKIDFTVDRIILSKTLDNSADKYLIFERLDISYVVPEDYELFGPDGIGFPVGPNQGNTGPVIDDEKGNIITDQRGIPLEGD